MRELLTLAMVLGMVSVAGAGNDWDGGGDGTTWSDGDNWDDPENVPPAEGEGWSVNDSWNNGNWDIVVDQNWTCGGGEILAGYTVNLTLPDGITLTHPLGSAGNGTLTYRSAGHLTVGPNAFYDMRYGQLGLESGDLTVTIEPDGYLFCSTLRHNNGAMVDVYGVLEAWLVSRISAEGTYRLNVYDGGEFIVHSEVPFGPWGDDGLVTMFGGSTVTLYGDWTSDYLSKVQAGEPGTWDVVFDGAWTTIQLVSPTCNTPAADNDGDGDVDQVDFAALQRCIGADPVGEDCQCFDMGDDNDDGTPDYDDDIDQFDLRAFIDCATGPDVPWTQAAAPDCNP